MKNSVSKAVPTAVPSSTDNSVRILTEPQLGPYQPMTGSSINPKVPNSRANEEIPPQPYFTGGNSAAKPVFTAGSAGAPSVPVDGFLFRAPPIDPHYTMEAETQNPYATTGRPGTVGWYTPVTSYQNHVAHSQRTTETGFSENTQQQRTSYMRMAPPPVGYFGTQTAPPKPQPQAPRFNRIRPSIGSDKYGTGVLNTDTYGAGQTAGGIGGNSYTPPASPPATTVIDNPPATTEATWG